MKNKYSVLFESAIKNVYAPGDMVLDRKTGKTATIVSNNPNSVTVTCCGKKVDVPDVEFTKNWISLDHQAHA